MELTPRKARDLAIHRAGGPTAVSKALRLSVSAISQWKAIPGPHLEALHELTGFGLHQLRPDWFKKNWVVRDDQ